MSQLVYIGDEASAAGYRLAGVRVYTPDERSPGQTLAAALGDGASLLMLSTAFAARLPAAELEHLLAGTRPPVLLVPDVRGEVPMPDLATRLRRELGMLE